MEINSPAGNVYSVVKRLGGTDNFRLYECHDPDGQQLILKVAAETEDNALLDHEAYMLGLLYNAAGKLEILYRAQAGEEKALNYQFLFPTLVETFILESQGERRVNILSFAEICKNIGELVPLAHIWSRDQVRVDERTSAWMLGKFLKLLTFAHNQGVTINKLDGDNLLINREQHYVAVFDWSTACYAPEEVGAPDVRTEISAITNEVLRVLGGVAGTGKEIQPAWPDSDARYFKLLYDLATGEFDDAKQAHAAFYATIDDIWPRGFHPYTAFPLN